MAQLSSIRHVNHNNRKKAYLQIYINKKTDKIDKV